jgi:hypothetical protein
MVRQNWWNQKFDRYYIGLKDEVKEKIRQAYRDLDLHSGGRSFEHYDILQEYIGDYYISGESLQQRLERINKNYDTNIRSIGKPYNTQG